MESQTSSDRRGSRAHKKDQHTSSVMGIKDKKSTLPGCFIKSYACKLIDQALGNTPELGLGRT
eukprot:1147168-Pelagomonas_calceolata.AAC.4